MKYVQIICHVPGMRRNGIEHPASKTYEEGHWSDAELEVFRRDPGFIVQDVDPKLSSVKGEAAFEGVVQAEVEKQLKQKAADLQLAFDTAVADAAETRISEASARANDEIAGRDARIKDLETRLEEALKPAAKK